MKFVNVFTETKIGEKNNVLEITQESDQSLHSQLQGLKSSLHFI